MQSKRGIVSLILTATLLGGCATRLDLQGHRGARGLAPENTLAAFSKALEIGVSTLELDVGITRDGVMVVSHDRYLNPDVIRDAQGQPGASPWLAGFDVDDYGGSLPKLVKAVGGTVWSPNFRDVSEVLVREAQSLGLKIVPWTVNDEADLARLLDWKVDGLITDYPDRLRALMKARGMALPTQYPAKL